MAEETQNQQNEAEKQDSAAPETKAEVVEVKALDIVPGMVVKVHQKIKEGEKERTQIFEGLIINGNSGQGSSKTITVRKEVEGIGVEKIFPLSSPNVTKIEVVKTFGVRRAKLFYLRDQKGISTRLSAKLGLTERDGRMKKNETEPEEEVATETATPESSVDSTSAPEAAESIPATEGASETAKVEPETKVE